MMGNKGGEACGMACEAESKPRGTADLFRHIPSGVVKSRCDLGIKIYNVTTQLRPGAFSTDFVGPYLCPAKKQKIVLQSQHEAPLT
jgi:hypothetical protein